VISTVIAHHIRLFACAMATLVAVFPGATASQAPIIAPVTDAMLLNPDPADWPHWRRTLDGSGYSPLAQITPKNVHQLQLAWSWSLQPGQSQPAPIVSQGVMYIPIPGGGAQALDAATGDLRWEYKPSAQAGVPPRTSPMRTLAIYDDKIYIAVADARWMALDARTGRLVWEHQVADNKIGYTYKFVRNRHTQDATTFKLYADDNNGKFPPGNEWCDKINRYVGSPKVFQCPAQENQRCSYAFNRNLSDKKHNEVPRDTVLLFESDAGWNKASGPELLISRHGGRPKTYLVAFADGSAGPARLSDLDDRGDRAGRILDRGAVVDELGRRGFTEGLRVVDGRLRAIGSDETVRTEDPVIREVYRFVGLL
jgi:hypothetical protein